MHVVTQVRYDKRHGREQAEVRREAGEGPVARGRHVAEVDPGVMGADIAERKVAAATGVSGRRHALGITSEAQVRTDEFGAEVRHAAEVMRAIVPRDALRGTREQ